MACGPKFKNLYYCSRLYFYRRSHSLYSKNRHRKHGYSGYDVLPKVYLSGSGHGEDWSRWWTIFYWAMWIVYAPVIGIFLTRLCYGRTVRQFLLVNLVAPAIFGIIWFTIFGVLPFICSWKISSIFGLSSRIRDWRARHSPSSNSYRLGRSWFSCSWWSLSFPLSPWPIP